MKNFIFALVLLAVVAVLYSCGQKTNTQPKEPVGTQRTVNISEFAKVIADTQKVVLVDVRTKEEYDEGHLKGARQIDVKSNTFRLQCLDKLPKEKTIAVYCRSGFRSKTAANILSESGFNVVNMGGGYRAWEEAGMETEK